MLRIAISCVVISALLNAASPLHAVLYKHDADFAEVPPAGPDHEAISVSNGGGVDVWWANEFDVVPGGEVITEIGLSFGALPPTGSAITLAVYDDQDDDGLPDDLQLLYSEQFTVGMAGSGFNPPEFFTLASPTTVTGKFFIAAALLGFTQADMEFESVMPTATSVSQQRSWLAIDEDTPGTFDLTNVVSETSGISDLAPTIIDNLGIIVMGQNLTDGNWVLRAQAISAIPEPGAWAFLLLSAAAIGAATTFKKLVARFFGGAKN